MPPEKACTGVQVTSAALRANGFSLTYSTPSALATYSARVPPLIASPSPGPPLAWQADGRIRDRLPHAAERAIQRTAGHRPLRDHVGDLTRLRIDQDRTDRLTAAAASRRAPRQAGIGAARDVRLQIVVADQAGEKCIGAIEADRHRSDVVGMTFLPLRAAIDAAPQPLGCRAQVERVGVIVVHADEAVLTQRRPGDLIRQGRSGPRLAAVGAGHQVALIRQTEQATGRAGCHDQGTQPARLQEIGRGRWRVTVCVGVGASSNLEIQGAGRRDVSARGWPCSSGSPSVTAMASAWAWPANR